MQGGHSLVSQLLTEEGVDREVVPAWPYTHMRKTESVCENQTPISHDIAPPIASFRLTTQGWTRSPRPPPPSTGETSVALPQRPVNIQTE